MEEAAPYRRTLSRETLKQNAWVPAETDKGRHYGLAEIEDYIDPFGCIMAGDLPPFWQTGKRPRR